MQHPICSTLCRYLQKIPNNGGVLIANQGEHMTGNFALDLSLRRQRWIIASWGEAYRINCPFCNDTRHRLWVNHRYGQPDPANPSWPADGLVICFNEDCLKDPDNRKQLFDWIFELPNMREHVAPVLDMSGVTAAGPRLQPCQWPGQMEALPDFCLEYLAQRGFYGDTVALFGLRYCVGSQEFPSAAGRIIVPIYHNRQMVGWQGRTPGEPTSRHMPKYYTMPHFAKRAVLYNLDNARGRSFCVVFEGVTDVWRLPGYGVALLGKTISVEQQNLLRASFSDGQPIILCLDPETWDNSALKIHEMIRNGANPVVRVRLPDSFDPASLGADTLLNTIVTQSQAVGIRLQVGR